MPKLSIRDGNILWSSAHFRTGRTLSEKPVGTAYALDTFELAPLISARGLLYQPTLTGIIQVRSEGTTRQPIQQETSGSKRN